MTTAPVHPEARPRQPVVSSIDIRLIRDLMRRKRVTGKQLADAFAVSEGYVSRILAGEKRMPLAYLLWLGAQLDFDPFHLAQVACGSCGERIQ